MKKECEIVQDLLFGYNDETLRKSSKELVEKHLVTNQIVITVGYDIDNLSNIMFWAFIIGNIIYYAIGIILAIILKDNRAFCKYICPITVFLKPMSYFSILRVKCDKEKCVSCKKCVNECPMNVDMLDNSRKRENGTECILCLKCIDECPKKALHL